MASCKTDKLLNYFVNYYIISFYINIGSRSSSKERTMLHCQNAQTNIGSIKRPFYILFPEFLQATNSNLKVREVVTSVCFNIHPHYYIQLNHTHWYDIATPIWNSRIWITEKTHLYEINRRACAIFMKRYNGSELYFDL